MTPYKPGSSTRSRPADMRGSGMYKAQGKPKSTGDSVLPHPMKLPGETQDMWHAGEYENGCGNGAKYD